MDNMLSKVGQYCQKDYEVQILNSAAGYYVGTVDEDGLPNCRLSHYYGKTPDDEVMNIQRECEENQFCNGYQIEGCKFKPYKGKLIDHLRDKGDK